MNRGRVADEEEAAAAEAEAEAAEAEAEAAEAEAEAAEDLLGILCCQAGRRARLCVVDVGWGHVQRRVAEAHCSSRTTC